MPDSNAFCGIGKYESGSEDETDIRPGPPSCFRHVPDLENPFHPVIRCHISEPQNPLEPALINAYPMLCTISEAGTSRTFFLSSGSISRKI